MAVILTDEQWKLAYDELEPKFAIPGIGTIPKLDNKIFEVLALLENYVDSKTNVVDVLFWQTIFLDKVLEECRRILPNTKDVIVDDSVQIVVLGTLRLGVALTMALAELNQEADDNSLDLEAEAQNI